MSQKGGMGVPLGRAAAAGPLSSDTSLPTMQFRDVEGTIRYFQLPGQRIPSHFLETLRLAMVVSEERDFLVGGNASADSPDFAVNSHIRHSGSLINLLYQAVGIASSLPVVASGSGGVCQLDEIESLEVQTGVQSSGSGRLPSPPPPTLFFFPSFHSSRPFFFSFSSSCLSFPVFISFFSLLLWFHLWLPARLSLKLSPLSPHPFATFAPPFPSLSSAVHPLAPSVSTFAPSVSSLAPPVVTVTSSFPSSSLASFSYSLVFLLCFASGFC